jgi:hypothetical protein
MELNPFEKLTTNPNLIFSILSFPYFYTKPKKYGKSHLDHDFGF